MRNFKYTIIGIIILLAGYFVLDVITGNVGREAEIQEVKTAEVSEAKDCIAFGRYGSLKGIYNITSNIKRDSKIFEGRLDMISGTKDKLYFNYWTNIAEARNNKNISMTFENADTTDRCLGIYTCSILGRDARSLAPDYIMLDRPAISAAGNFIVFAGERTRNGIADQCIDFGIYRLNTDSKLPLRLKVKCDGREDIKSISFTGNNEIVYSKKVYSNGEYLSQLFRYNFETEKEEQITKGNSNYLSPAASPDGKKLAYLSFSQSRGIYGINIVETADISRNIYSDANDAVVGGSIEWSPDSSKLLYVVLSDVLMDGKIINGNKIKMSDIRKMTSEYIDEGYAGTFSPDSSSIAYSDYEIEKKDNDTKDSEYKCVETIYKKKIGGTRNIVLQYDEDCLYSKSMNMLFWYK